jgi:hypothetical protein
MATPAPGQLPVELAALALRMLLRVVRAGQQVLALAVAAPTCPEAPDPQAVKP